MWISRMASHGKMADTQVPSLQLAVHMALESSARRQTSMKAFFLMADITDMESNIKAMHAMRANFRRANDMVKGSCMFMEEFLLGLLSMTRHRDMVP